MDYKICHEEKFISLCINESLSEAYNYFLINKSKINLYSKFGYPYDDYERESTMLLVAVSEGLWEVVDFLIANGLDFEKDPCYSMVMEMIVGVKDPDFVLKLSPNFHLQKGIKYQESVISYLAYISPSEIPQYIAKFPESVLKEIKSIDTEGYSVFHYLFGTSDSEPEEILKAALYLIELGADPKLKDNGNKSPVEIHYVPPYKFNPPSKLNKEYYELFFITLIFNGFDCDFNWDNLNMVPKDSVDRIYSRVEKLQYIKNNLR